MTTDVAPFASSRIAKPRIVISSYDDLDNPAYGGGGARAIGEVVKRLTPHYNLTVLFGNYRGARSVIRSGVRYQPIGPTWLPARLAQLMFHFSLPWYVHTTPHDLWIENFTPPFSTSCLQLFTRRPVIGLVHMLSGVDMRRKYHLPFDLIEHRGLKTYHQFIVLTAATELQIRRFNPNATITIIPNGVNPGRPVAPASLSFNVPAPGYVLLLGRLEINQKGIDLLLAALAQCPTATRPRLVITGSGTSRAEIALRQQIQALQLTNFVTLTGWAKDDQKAALMQGAAALVMPSRFETFGLSALEGMAYGKPVICFDLPSLSWIAPTVSVKVPPFSTADLAQALTEITTDHRRRNQLGSAAKKFSAQFSWDAVAERYHQAINRSLAA